jgi:hypothetical protein
MRIYVHIYMDIYMYMCILCLYTNSVYTNYVHKTLSPSITQY